ncbi:MAG: hypothetical protein SGI73_18505 [Chloroflexota bacterium]|nr:hypothetical protein [Chloroflexota bacterium]
MSLSQGLLLMNFATYTPDSDGFIRHWLTCGVITTSLENVERIVDPVRAPFSGGGRWILNYWAWSQASKSLKLRVYRNLPPLAWTPPDQHPVLHGDGIGGKRWEYAAVEEDGAADFSRFNFTPTRMQGWLFALLDVDAPMILRAEVQTIGPARVFLNGTLHTHNADEFSYVAIRRVPVALALRAGQNALYLQGEMVGWREARLALGLRLTDDARERIRVRLPLGDVDADAWQRAEAGLNALNVKQFAFPTLPGYVEYSPQPLAPSQRSGEGAAFTFDADVELPIPENVSAQLGTLARPQSQARLTLTAGERGELPIMANVTAGMSGMPGENSLLLHLRPADGTPIELKRELWAGAKPFSTQPYGDYDARKREALEHLAAMPYDILAAMAALTLRKIERVPSEAVTLACHFMENRYDCADFYAIGLLALLYRFDNSKLHPADAERIKAAFLGFKYWLDEPGLDAMCYFTENHQILFHVAAYLAGQFWRREQFTNSGRTGDQQMKRARPRVEDWIRRRLRGNFSEWDSNAYLTLDAFAMLALAEFDLQGQPRDMATALLDKIFFMLACQSYRGALGSTHGRCYVTALKSARVENTSALGRIAWGMGLFNGETRATGLLALAVQYRVPDVIQQIGADVDRVLVTRARSRGQFRPQFDMRGDEWDVTTLTLRTPDVMLSAALDYQPGTMGIQEHLWQATLSPEASVFTTYPGNSQEHGNARPNFWAGSARLPRVGMHRRTVICLYRLEAGIGMDFTHAYFPTAAFDEWHIAGGWAFARVGNGYVALWGDGDLTLTANGRHAGQELRSGGRGEAWLCCVGRTADDGDFATFRANVIQNAPLSDDDGVTWTTPDGETLAFGWETPFMLDGVAQSWDDSPHYDNAYTQTPMDANSMTIAHNGLTLTLNLKRSKRKNQPG